ncbi:MAG: hypothetical protein WCD81_08855 [Candidatus Bathyarchaeia archaeon]
MRIHIANKVSIVLILMAGASLVSMLATLNIDHIIHHDLYNYGLQFSPQWADPYWRMAAVVFSMGWFIILTSVAFELHFVMQWRRRHIEPQAPCVAQEQVQNQPPITETKPSDKLEEKKAETTAEEEAKTTALVAETEDDLSEFRVLLEEISVRTDEPVTRQKADDSQANEK